MQTNVRQRPVFVLEGKKQKLGLIRRQFVGPCILKEYVLPRFVFFNMAIGNVTFLLVTGGTIF